MRPSLQSLAQQTYDVLIVGAGINGAAAAHAAVQQGYRVALLDAADYGSGASSRSSRLLHCGLRYLMPGGPLTTFVRHPGRFLDVLRTVRRSMAVRSAFVLEQPERARPIRMHYPVYRDGPYAPWLVDVAFGLLGALSDRKVALDYKRTPAREALAGNPFAPWLGNKDKLAAIASYTEYQFDWPERVVLDLALAARQLGAAVRNYTRVTAMRRQQDGWLVDVSDSITAQTATLHARAILNIAGTQVDAVNACADVPVGRKITGTKGAHIMFRLPSACRGQGLASVSSVGRPFYCMPWRDLHFFGPTETLYEGDPDKAHADTQDVDFLLREANSLFPSLGLERSDIVSTWAGVRPLTYDPALPMGHRSRRIYDQSDEGMPDMFSLSNGSLGAHRQTGKDLVQALRQRVAPSDPPQAGPAPASPIPDLAQILAKEDVVLLDDLMTRRLGLAWDAGHGLDQAAGIAAVAAQSCGWDAARQAEEVARYEARTRCLYGVRS
ncbi:FAD-dependent oxidoreductase [Paracandidimonas soli]|uniref:Glycerol-3-phosphate dehydrogenase n=1 Tax=Paracandidimonas soli TaxID=1917182 RepID=A0A4R3VIY7_9BURK|nr:FAD-dependent oxidoreductase [Paracandidimonas soli]TCV02945.1 glycerol-3-phosphate dehydrogenase [Paracandidimonas soli]